MRIDKLRATRIIKDLIGGSFIVNRDPAAISCAKCQVWSEKDGNYTLLARGRTWEAAISQLRTKADTNNVR